MNIKSTTYSVITVTYMTCECHYVTQLYDFLSTGHVTAQLLMMIY